MGLLRNLYCHLLKSIGFDFKATYVKEDDPLFHRYNDLDRRVTRLERVYWRPRDLLDIR